MEHPILECKNINEICKCNISYNDYIRSQSGNYYLRSKTGEKYYDQPPIKLILPNNVVQINVEYEDNKEQIYIGDKAFLYFKTNYNDNETNIFNASDIEEKTSFIGTSKYYEKIYTKCRLWKPLNEQMWIFCNLNDRLSSYDIRLKDVAFNYKEYIIAILFNTSLRINKLNVLVPVLYSDRQIIDILEEKDSYYLKLHIGLYNGEPLCLSLGEMKNIFLRDCNNNGKDLICNIKKENLYEIFTNSNQKLQLLLCDYDLKSKIKFNVVYDIIFNFNSIQKEDIFMNITKLSATNVNSNTFTAFETNITNISDIISDSFWLNFNNSQKFNCSIKKTIQTPLLIICLMPQKGTFSLEEIKEEIILDNINIKYNFRIQPTNLNEQCKVEGDGNFIKNYFPMVLNYTLKDTINIVFNYNFDLLKMPDITLNPDANKLTCDALVHNNLRKCVAPKSHFAGKKNGSYPILYFNYLNNKVISYQLSPVEVIIVDDNIIIKINKEDNKDLKIGQKGILYLITDYDDKRGIFKDTYIPFDSTIKDENDKKYNVNCKLWIPKNQKIRLICKLNENLENIR